MGPLSVGSPLVRFQALTLKGNWTSFPNGSSLLVPIGRGRLTSFILLAISMTFDTIDLSFQATLSVMTVTFSSATRLLTCVAAPGYIPLPILFNIYMKPLGKL